MVPDLDIWLAANLLIERHGDDAEFVAAKRADEMLERGDGDEEIVWLRIRRAIAESWPRPWGSRISGRPPYKVGPTSSFGSAIGRISGSGDHLIAIP
jgi:hypothetical protein